jgi:hypothetical protein
MYGSLINVKLAADAAAAPSGVLENMFQKKNMALPRNKRSWTLDCWKLKM